MRDALKRFNEAFEEGTFAFSDRIVGLTDDDLWENEVDPDTEIRANSHRTRRATRSQ